MSTVYLWVCDQCEAETRDGLAGCPPEGWVKVDAHTLEYITAHAELCPACAVNADVLLIARRRGKVVQPAKRKAKNKDEALFDDPEAFT